MIVLGVEVVVVHKVFVPVLNRRTALDVTALHRASPDGAIGDGAAAIDDVAVVGARLHTVSGAVDDVVGDGKLQRDGKWSMVGKY